MTTEVPPKAVRRIAYMDGCGASLEAVQTGICDYAAALGFDTLLVAFDASPIGVGSDSVAAGADTVAQAGGGKASFRKLADATSGAGLDLWTDLALDRFPADHPFVAAHPEAFSIRRRAGGEGAIDPRRPAPLEGVARACLEEPAAAKVIAAAVAKWLVEWAKRGLKGVRTLGLDAAPVEFWAQLIETVRRDAPNFAFLAETEGVPRSTVLKLRGLGFDALISSLPYWDGRARWFVEEYQALRAIAPLIAPVAGERANTAHSPQAMQHRLRLAAATGMGFLAPLKSFGDEMAEGSAESVRAANALSAELAHFGGEMRVLTGEGAAVTALLRVNAADVRRATAGLLILVNPDQIAPTEIDPQDFLQNAGAEFEPFTRIDGGASAFAPLDSGEVRLLLARRSRPIAHPLQPGRGSAEAAAITPRLVVEGVTPSVEGGPYPVRRIVGERVTVEADIFADGHEQLSAELRWRPLGEEGWNSTSMAELGNDRWRASFPLDRMGRYEFVVEGWLDIYAGFRRDFRKKREAGVAQPVDVLEGVEFVKRACKRAKAPLRAAVKEHLDRIKGAASDADRGDHLLDEVLAELMRQADERPFSRTSRAQFVDAERLQARFASWYEIFPRSQTDNPNRHGNFDDVIARLPRVREMGFDVLYFPPIHPIGKTNRKGRNNTLSPGEDDPGSPYAIGSAEGGHEAVHPELGTFDDFRRLVRAAAEQGLEIALDFAIQCSPDHPWLKQHPGWFDWRPDGTIKYAENPPKKYQDIVNVDFYKLDAVPGLWLALRDVVLLWIGEGVRLFRVDNPHTKPLAFWEWMIREVRSAHPDVVFLAEAFTRPKVMYRLAKIGFSQSYTYFTWRNSKAELIEYMTELTTTAPKEFFRPHFFVNTPDINPTFLQTSGRAGFLIRAALAATLSGLFGVYAGFELCEWEPLGPGKEEYKDSEKFELKPRPDRAAGDIVDELAKLNRIRKGHPALQTHLGVEFLLAWNDDVVVYVKSTSNKDDVIVVAVSLDPHNAQETTFELPLWRLGVHEGADMEVEDLVWEARFMWQGNTQHVRLTPDHPYAIWSLRPPRVAL